MKISSIAKVAVTLLIAAVTTACSTGTASLKQGPQLKETADIRDAYATSNIIKEISIRNGIPRGYFNFRLNAVEGMNPLLQAEMRRLDPGSAFIRTNINAHASKIWVFDGFFNPLHNGYNDSTGKNRQYLKEAVAPKITINTIAALSFQVNYNTGDSESTSLKIVGFGAGNSKYANHVVTNVALDIKKTGKTRGDYYTYVYPSECKNVGATRYAETDSQLLPVGIHHEVCKSMTSQQATHNAMHYILNDIAIDFLLSLAPKINMSSEDVALLESRRAHRTTQ